MKKRKLTRKTKKVIATDYIPSTGDEKLSNIAKSMGISRQAVSQTLRRGLKKFYYGVQSLDTSWPPFQVAAVMAKMLQQDQSVKDLKAFINMLPKDIQKIVIEDAVRNTPSIGEA